MPPRELEVLRVLPFQLVADVLERMRLVVRQVNLEAAVDAEVDAHLHLRFELP